MKFLPILAALTAIVSLGACTGSGQSMLVQAVPGSATAIPVNIEPPRETILLVSLADGSVVMQTIRSHADVCFKNNADSLTTCLTRGAAILDPATDTVIGYEMIEDKIDLIASSR